MEGWIDRDWYRRNIADPDTGAPIRFRGTPLGNIDSILDALYFGIAFENARRKLEHELIGVFQFLDVLAGREPRKHRLDLLDTTAWLWEFGVLWDASNVPSHLDPALAINFRLDVLRSMSALPRSYRRAVTHALDGYDLEEIAELMGWRKPRWRSIGQVEAGGELQIQVGTEPNLDSAERVVRSSSSTMRGRCSLAIRKTPKPPQPVPQMPMLPAGDYTTDVVMRIESEIGVARQCRQGRARHSRGPELSRAA